jgi:hypothetical protein
MASIAAMFERYLMRMGTTMVDERQRRRKV